MSVATEPYNPVITEAHPFNVKQRRLYSQGFRGYWVEASGQTIVNGLTVTRYLVTMMPGMYLKCPCEAGKHGNPCRHKSAVRAWLGGPRTTNVIAVKPVSQAIFVCPRTGLSLSKAECREAALLDTDHGYAGDIFKAASSCGNRSHSGKHYCSFGTRDCESGMNCRLFSYS